MQVFHKTPNGGRGSGSISTGGNCKDAADTPQPQDAVSKNQSFIFNETKQMGSDQKTIVMNVGVGD